MYVSLETPERGMARQPNVELVGANAKEIQLGAATMETKVRMDRPVTQRIARSLNAGAGAEAVSAQPDRVFLNLEGISGTKDSAVFYVYVNLPAGADPGAHPEKRAGAVSLFGVSKASGADDPHGGNGLNEVLEITRIVDDMHLAGSLDASDLNIRFVPRGADRNLDGISIRRVSVYRQGH